MINRICISPQQRYTRARFVASFCARHWIFNLSRGLSCPYRTLPSPYRRFYTKEAISARKIRQRHRRRAYSSTRRNISTPLALVQIIFQREITNIAIDPRYIASTVIQHGGSREKRLETIYNNTFISKRIVLQIKQSYLFFVENVES